MNDDIKLFTQIKKVDPAMLYRSLKDGPLIL